MIELPRTEIHVESDILELVPDFCDARKIDLDNLSQFLKTSEFDAIAKITHTIKGIARPFGFPTLETLCQELETAAHARDPKRSSRALSQIKDYVQSYLFSPGK